MMSNWLRKYSNITWHILGVFFSHPSLPCYFPMYFPGICILYPVQFCFIKYGRALLLDPLPLWWYHMINKRCLMIFLWRTQYIHGVATTVSHQSHTHLIPVPCQSNASHAPFSCQSHVILMPVTLRHAPFSNQTPDSLMTIFGLLLSALLSNNQ